MTDVDELQLGPTQREVYRILEADGGELRSGEVADRGDRLSHSTTQRALSRLGELGHVNVCDSGDPRDISLYSVADDAEVDR